MSIWDYYESKPHLLEVAERIKALEKEMRQHAQRLEFEEAAVLRDKIQELRELQIYAG